MLDYYLLIDNNFKSFFNEDITTEIERYNKIVKELNNKLKRIKKAYVDSVIELDEFKDEEISIKRQIEETELKLNNLKQANKNINNKEELKLYTNLFQLEKLKHKSYYVRKNGLWNKLSKEQKSELIKKYIDSIEIQKVKDEIIIKKININKKEIENIGYMFRNDCFDMIINVNEQDLILSNFQNEQNRKDYITNLRNFYNIKETNITGEILDMSEFNTNDIVQIIPHEKSSKFDKNKFTILQIEV